MWKKFLKKNQYLLSLFFHLLKWISQLICAIITNWLSLPKPIDVEGKHVFFPIFCGRHTGNQPQEKLAKFGYRLERKVEKFKYCSYTYILVILACFFHKSFCLFELHWISFSSTAKKLERKTLKRMWVRNLKEHQPNTVACLNMVATSTLCKATKVLNFWWELVP
jgi:hypothetical protein